MDRWSLKLSKIMTKAQLPRHWIVVFTVICGFAAARPDSVCGAQPSSIPRLRKQGAATQGAQTSEAVSGGLVIAAGPDEFIFAGTGLVVTFEANTPGPPLVGILSVQEGKYVEGHWIYFSKVINSQPTSTAASAANHRKVNSTFN